MGCAIMNGMSEQARWFRSAVGDDVYESLSDAQRDAVCRAAGMRFSDAFSSDIRLSFGRYFMTVLVGRERRKSDRLRAERARRPVFTARNLPVILAIWGSLMFTLYSLVALGLRGFLTLLA
jgi:hypothetical protein